MSWAPTAPKVLLVPALVLAVASQPAAASEEAGRVEVRITDHRAGIGDFRELRVQLAKVWLHRRGQPRGTGWVELIQSATAVDITPLKDGRWATIGEGHVEAVSYDAVRVRFGGIQGELRRGGLAKVIPIGSTVAVDLTLEAGSRQILLIDLYVEDQTDHQPGLYTVKIRDVQVGKP